MKKLLILLVSVMLCTILMVAASATTFVNPVAPGADPFVFKDDDGTYYLYATTGDTYGYRVFSSKNLVEWEGRGYCLLEGDVFDDPDIKKDYPNSEGVYESPIACFWAPEVIKYEGKYYMVYTYQQHLGFAVSDSPLGPFVNGSDSYLFDNQAIDGNFFLDDDGTMYLYFVSETTTEMNGQKVKGNNNIWGCILDMDTLTVDEDSITLLVRWDASVSSEKKVPIVEGPAMIKNGDTYYMTFSSGGYGNTDYSVHYATSDKPLGIDIAAGEALPGTDANGYALGTFERDYENIVLISDDLDYSDNAKEHLYGTAHHSFTTSPDGSERYIVYHAHRNGWGQTLDSYGRFAPRVTCIDKAWFDENGVLRAGSEANPGVPTATAQELPSGAVLERETHYEGVFEDVSANTIYVAYYDGLDTNEGTEYRKPVKTIEKAAELLKETGGTIAIIQDYVVDTYLDIPACDKPLIITSAAQNNKEHILTYKFISVNSDVYFDNIILAPEILNNISVIECNFNNVVIGDGVSCLFSPHTREFAYLCGGKWWYSGSDSNAIYDNFEYSSETDVTTADAYTIAVYGGSWSVITAESMKDRGAMTGTAENAVLTLGEGVAAMPLPAKTSDLSVRVSSKGAVVTYAESENADKYQIRRDGEIVGYSETTTFVDSEIALGGNYTYTVHGYVNGCCVGNSGAEVTLATYGDRNGDGVIELEDGMLLAKSMLDGTSEATLLDLIVLFFALVK